MKSHKLFIGAINLMPTKVTKTPIRAAGHWDACMSSGSGSDVETPDWVGFERGERREQVKVKLRSHRLTGMILLID